MSQESGQGSNVEPIKFKKSKRANLRQRHESSEDERDTAGKCDEGTDDVDWEKLDLLREYQRLKKRVNRGVNVAELGKVDRSTTKKEKKLGGLVDNKANELDLNNTFSVETNRRDEDADMMKYIEEELAKKKGMSLNTANSANESSEVKKLDDVFSILSEHLVKSSKKKNEEMLSNQMLNGIPEVDLGITERIRNIEATEEAKTKLLSSRNTKSTPQSEASTMVPTNITVNFAQNNKHNVDELALVGANRQRRFIKPQGANNNLVEEPVVVIGSEPKQEKFKVQSQSHDQPIRFPGKEKATDDYHYERFKKQFKKY